MPDRIVKNNQTIVLQERNIMGEVIGITRANESLVQLLEKLLSQAKSGRLTALAAVVLKDNEADFAIEVPGLTTLELIGAIEVLKGELLNQE